MFSKKLKVHADRAIDFAELDQFNRANFVGSLSEVISQSASRNGSITLALTGPWGSGKTSLKNLVKEKLASKPNPPSVMEFLPWQLSGTGKITPLFFDALIKQMSKEKVFKNFKEQRKKLRAYAKLLARGETLVRVVPSFGPFLGAPIKAASDSLADIGKEPEDLVELKSEISKALATYRSTY